MVGVGFGGGEVEGFVVELAVDEIVPHPVVVPRVEFEIAHGAAEAREVVDEVARAHYHLVRGDAELAARAFLRAVPSANNGERKRS